MQKNDRIPYVPFAMILRQQSYTISRSFTCPPIFPCLTILLGKRSFIHFDNTTFYRFGISFAQLLHAKLQQPERAGMEKKIPPHSSPKRTRTQDYTPNGFKQKGLLSFASFKFEKGIHTPSFYITGARLNATVFRTAQWYNIACQLCK